MDRPVQPLSIFKQILGLYRRHAVSLLVLGVIILTPMALLEVLADDVGTIDTGDGIFLTLSNLLVVSATVTTTLLGEVFYSGAVALLVLHHHDGSKISLRGVFKKLPLGRLIAVDVLYSVIVLIGFLLLIVPGLILMTWYWLAGAIIEVEDRGPFAALKRSRELVRGSFWRVFAVVLPLTVLTALVGSVGARLTPALLGHSLFGEWMTGAIWDILLTPVYALGVIIVLVRLSGHHFTEESHGS